MSGTDVETFLSATGIVGLQLALLCYIAENTIGNIAEPSKALGVSAGPLRERLLVLQAAGLVGAPKGRGGFTLENEVTPRGRVFLDLLRRLEEERAGGALSPELRFILARLRVEPNEEKEPEELNVFGLSFDRLTVVLSGGQAAVGH